MGKEIKQIKIYAWMKQEIPVAAVFCDAINEALQINPDMSLAEFAEIVDAHGVKSTKEQMFAAEAKQLKEVLGCNS